MSALGRVVRSGVRRRRVSTIVTGLVVAVAVTSAVLGLTLLVASRGPFDRAFRQQHGAHLTAQFDAATVTPEQLTASAGAAGVSAAAGPFRQAVLSTSSAGHPLPPLSVVGRGGPDSAVDGLTLTEGRWATGPGELVLSADSELPMPRRRGVNTELTLTEVPGSPTVTVVGYARSVSRSADAWAAPESVAAWGTGYQMLYRLDDAATTAEVERGRAAIAASLPAGALTGALSWLATRHEAVAQAALLIPFLVAFGVLAVVMAMLIIGNVIAGAVATATRRIGVLKALGFTPGQVVRAYVGQALVPAVVGAAVGVVAGNLLVVPLLDRTNDIYGATDSGLSPVVSALVVAGALAVVAVTAWAAAARAGLLRSVDALAVGRTPSPGRGQWAARLTGRLPWTPRPVSLGLAHPFARPLRSAAMVASIAFGAAAVTFAVGLGASLNRVQEVEDFAAVQIRSAPPEGRGGPGPSGPAPFADPGAVVAAITAADGTAGYLGTARSDGTVAGVTGALSVVSLTGTDSAGYYRMVRGSWLTGPGQIVVSTPFLTASGKDVGDTVTLTRAGIAATVTIVGEVFNPDEDGMQILTDLATPGPAVTPEAYYLTVEPGTDVEAYAAALSSVLRPLGAQADVVDHDVPETVLVIDSLTALLSILLVVVAGLGVLNLVVLETRERVHDLGVHKALGMTPGQTTTMVISSVVFTGVLGGVAGTALGVVLQRTVLAAMGSGVGFTLPPSVIDVYRPSWLLAFAAGGLLIAVAGALLPAGWAARTRTVTALRTE